MLVSESIKVVIDAKDRYEFVSLQMGCAIEVVMIRGIKATKINSEVKLLTSTKGNTLDYMTFMCMVQSLASQKLQNCVQNVLHD